MVIIQAEYIHHHRVFSLFPLLGVASFKPNLFTTLSPYDEKCSDWCSIIQAESIHHLFCGCEVEVNRCSIIQAESIHHRTYSTPSMTTGVTSFNPNLFTT